jgi:uncharacterized integral membrane protein (TIGR00698 family)
MLIALLMGMAVEFLRESPRLRPGLAFTCKTLLRLGVALLGTQITLQYLADLGWGALLFVIFGVCLTIATGVLFARLFGQSAWFGVLMGGAVGICGAAAAAAISAVLPRHEKSNADTAMTIIGVTALSTVAMIAYPIIARSVGLDDRAIGFFLGLTIHDVAQVVGAGYSVSTEAGDLAVVVKLFRVILLLPVVLIVALSVRVAAHRGGSARPAVPLFVIGFALLVFARSFGIIPAEAAVHLSELSRWCLVIAMAAIGISTALGEIRELGYRPAMVLIGATAVIAFFGLAGALSPTVQGR